MMEEETLSKHSTAAAEFLRDWQKLSCGAILTDLKTVRSWGRERGPYIQRQQGFKAWTERE